MTQDFSLPFGDTSLTTDDWIEVRSPYDDALLGRVPKCDDSHVARATAIAKATHEAGAAAPYARAEILDRAAAALAQRVEEFARIVAAEAAKPIKTARVEAQRAVSTFQFAAVAARSLAGEMVPMDASIAGAGKLAFTLRVPIGVIGAISPFNFPLNLAAHKLAPAIASGNPIVLKPPSADPLTMLTIAEIIETASDGTVSAGSIVTIMYEGDTPDMSETYLIGHMEEKTGHLDVMSPQSPLGAALLGAAEGHWVEYEAPTGMLRVQVLKVALVTG